MSFNTNFNTNIWNINTNTNKINGKNQPIAGMVPQPTVTPKPSIFQPIKYPNPYKPEFIRTSGNIEPGTIINPKPNPYPIAGMIPYPPVTPKPPVFQPIGGLIDPDSVRPDKEQKPEINTNEIEKINFDKFKY